MHPIVCGSRKLNCQNWSVLYSRLHDSSVCLERLKFFTLYFQNTVEVPFVSWPFFQIMPLFLEIVVLYAGSFFLVYCFTTDHFLGCYWTALDWSFIAIIKFPFDCSLEVLQIVINYFIDNWKTRPTSVNLCRTVRECSQYRLVKFML